MDENRFCEIMAMIKGAYGERFQKLEPDVLDTWWNCLSDLDECRLAEAARRYIKSNQFPPTIADLRNIYRGVSAPEPKPFDRFKNVAPDMIEELLEAGLITTDGGVDYGDLSEVQFKALREAGAI